MAYPEKYSVNPIQRNSLLFIFLILFGLPSLLYAQNPVIKVDFDEDTRKESEVNEPGYIPWPIGEETQDARELDSIHFNLESEGGFQSHWYKAGIQAPYYARLANDGLMTGSVELTIAGLPEGRHTLLSYHNTYDNPENNTFSPVDIYLNGELEVDDLEQSNRVEANDASATSYLVFQVEKGDSVVIRYEAEMNSDASKKVVCISGFELNTGNAQKQARSPFPKDKDGHANVDSDSIMLRWKPADSAVSHDIYFGTSESAVSSAGHGSSQFKGNQTDTTYNVTGFSNMSQYFWRIDEVDNDGKLTQGDVWSFRPRHLAFEGAQGYGKYARGGRGGAVVEVTNLNDSGPGSLREAVTNNVGPRTIVFNVSGMITLESRLSINQSNITIAGQTAPGKGICIRGAPFGISGGEDIIIRHVRVRVGSGETNDGMGMAGSDHSIIDHSSISWAIDEAFSSRNGKNITLQRTLISEPLNVAGHSNYPPGTRHGYAGSVSGDIGSLHHNLLAHCYGRNWSLAGGLNGNGNFAGRLDIFNNVVYNWGSRTTDGGAHEVNFVNNYYKPGPASNNENALNAQYENFPGTQQYYFAGNIMPGVFGLDNQEEGSDYSGEPHGYEPWVDEPFFPSLARIHPAKEAYKRVLSDVGATQPAIDDHDVRVINETLEGSFTFEGSQTGLPGIPDSEEDVGGWEHYPEIKRSENWDADNDGMPGWWEKAKGLNPDGPENSYSEAIADADGDGFTNLEEYLMWMAQPHYMITADDTLTVDLAALSRGYTDNPEYAITDMEHGNASFNQQDTSAAYIPDESGLGSFTFEVTDDAGSSMSREINVFIGSTPEDTIIDASEPDPEPDPDTDPDTVANEPDEPAITNTNDLSNDWELSCYPNPATSRLYIESNIDHHAAVSIRVLNAMGQLVMDKEMNLAGHQANPVPIDQLSEGLYFMEVKTDKGKQRVKFLKR